MAEYDLPDEFRYSTDDEWVRELDDGGYLIGITDYAQQQLGDVVFVELPEIGASFAAGDTFGEIESVKSISDLCSPISGKVVNVNEALEDAPESVNADCYGDGWIIEMIAVDENPLEELMDADGYRKFIEERSE